MLKAVFILIGFLFLSAFSYSQHREPEFVSLTTRDGLSSNTVYDMLQDRHGFLWIATADGLNRYDGTEVVKFLHDGTPNSIPSDQVRCLALLPNDVMAIGTSAGLCLYNLKTGMYKQCYFDDGNGLAHYDNLIESITLDDDGNLWLCSATAILKITPGGKLLRIIRSSYTRKDIGRERFVFAYKIIRLPGRQLLFFLSNGNYVYDIDKDKMERLSSSGHERFAFLKNMPHTDVFEAGNNYLIFFKNNIDSIFFYRKMNDEIRGAYFPYPHEREWRKSVSGIDSTHFILAHQMYGYHMLQFEHGVFNVSEIMYGNYQFGKSLKDAQGNIWFVNYLGGLLKKPNASDRLRPIPLYDQATGNLIDVSVSFMMPWHNFYYISSYGRGLFIYDTASKRQRQINFERVGEEDDANYIWQITKHSADTLWIGTQRGMFWLTKDDHKGRLTNIVGKLSLLDSVAIARQFTDKKGRLWIALGKGNGVCYYDQRKNSFTFFKGRSESGYPFRYPIDIKEDKDGRLWFVSDHCTDLLYFDEKKRVFIPVSLPLKGKGYQTFTCIFIDSENIFWIGSNAGMVRYDPQDQSVIAYGREQGLCNSIIEDITEDSEGNLWINTDGGLSCLDKKKKLFTNFYQGDGLPSDLLDFRFRSLSDGQIVTGGYGGLAIFDPSHLLNTSHNVIPFLITDCSVNGHPVNIATGGPLKLNPSEKNISFRFSGIDLNNGPQSNYLYKLQGGGEDGWVNLGRQRQINFSNLAHGHYVLGLRCVDEAGNIISKDIQFAFYIRTPFTQTIWFYIILSTLAFLIFYAVYKYRINQLKRLEKIRAHISRDLHDEIGANLTNISYQSLVGKMNSDDREKTEASFAHIYEDSRKVSEAMREIIWNVNPVNDRLENALPRMLQYATELLEARQIRVEASLPPQSEKMELGMEQRRDLYLIFKEAINNIAKHAGASRVKILFSVNHKELTLQIFDDGKGYDSAKVFEGNGIRNMKSRASAHQWELKLNEANDTGSSFYLRAHLA